jgi:hypothetical protein
MHTGTFFPRTAPLAVLVVFGLSQPARVRAIDWSLIPTIDDTDQAFPLPGQGYLHFMPNGEDITGWTDIRNPAFYDGVDGKSTVVSNTTDPTGIGYDRSDFQVRVQNVIVTDKNGVKAGATGASVEQDFNYANQAYRALGVSVLSTGNVDATYNNVAFPAANPAGVDTILGANRPAVPVVPNYYVRDFNPAASGVGGGPSLPPSGTAIGDAHNPDSLAHEVTHFLLDANRFPTTNGNDAFHSTQVTDLVRAGTPGRTIPNANVKQAGVNTAPSQPGQQVGGIGGLDQFAAKVGAAGGPYNTAQIDAIYGNQSDGTAYVQRTADHHATYGDRADFNWVEDNIPLEEAAAQAGSNQRMVWHPGFDFMVWQINPGAVPGPLNEAVLGHNKGNWGELNLNGFNGPFVRAVDVVSQVARYADMDVDPANTNSWSLRDSALDYMLQFSADGNSWLAGVPILLFKKGWTTNSTADDYVARWTSPVDALFVRIQSETSIGQDDRNCQIDAIIAASVVPEPATLTLILLTCLLGGAFQLRRRRIIAE